MSQGKNTEKPVFLPAPYLRAVLEKRSAALLAAALLERDYEEPVRSSMLREFPDLPWQLRLLLTHPELAKEVSSGTRSASGTPSRSDAFFRFRIRAGSSYPFLRELLAQTEILPDEEIRPFGTDGLRFYVPVSPDRYGPVSYEDYTHMLVHAVFRHMALPERVAKRARNGHAVPLWDLAADLSAEYLRVSLFDDPKAAETRLAAKASLPPDCDPADPLAVFLALGDLFEDEIEPLYERFRRDDHRYWYRAPSHLTHSPSFPEDARSRSESGLTLVLSEKEETAGPDDRQENARVSPDRFKGLPKDAEDPSVWQEWLKNKVTDRWSSSGEEMSSGLGLMRSGQYGLAPGSREEKMVLREIGKYDFTRYLHRFSTLREEMSLDQASFDYIPYYYGLVRYGNMPLLEPLEYTESRKVEELVIAIDTSGSCSLPIVRRFFAEIERILMNRENFFRKMNIHIIQCDSIIQDHTVIHSQEEWKLYLQDLTIKGRGGTSFEPVFRLVEKLRDAGELKKLKGLLYFTDGDGAYPRYPTDYETAFVFTTRKALQFKIPEWIVPLCLDMQPAEKAPMFRT